MTPSYGTLATPPRLVQPVHCLLLDLLGSHTLEDGAVVTSSQGNHVDLRAPLPWTLTRKVLEITFAASHRKRTRFLSKRKWEVGEARVS
jgi:hypothetical protein